MKVHNLITQLEEYDPDAEVIISCGTHERVIEDVDLEVDTGEVVIETAEEEA